MKNKKPMTAQEMVRIRVAKQTPERRKEIALNAINTRWAKKRELDKKNEL